MLSKGGPGSCSAAVSPPPLSLPPPPRRSSSSIVAVPAYQCPSVRRKARPVRGMLSLTTCCRATRTIMKRIRSGAAANDAASNV